MGKHRRDTNDYANFETDNRLTYEGKPEIEVYSLSQCWEWQKDSSVWKYGHRYTNPLSLVQASSGLRFVYPL